MACIRDQSRIDTPFSRSAGAARAGKSPKGSEPGRDVERLNGMTRRAVLTARLRGRRQTWSSRLANRWVIAGAGVAIVLTVVGVIASGHQPGARGGIVTEALVAVAIGLILWAGAAWKQTGAWIAVAGLAILSVGSGVGRTRNLSFDDGYWHLDSKWWVVAIGTSMSIAAFFVVARQSHQRRGPGRRALAPHVPCAQRRRRCDHSQFSRCRALIIKCSSMERVGRSVGAAEFASKSCALGDVTDLWREAAGHEAASITAFHDLAARLERCDAPTNLVGRARRAARDEVRHTAACLAPRGDGPTATLRPAIPPERVNYRDRPRSSGWQSSHT